MKKAFNCLSLGSSNLLKLWSKLVPTGYGAKWAKCFRSWLWALASLLGSSLCRRPLTLQAAPRPFASPKDVASSTSTIVLFLPSNKRVDGQETTARIHVLFQSSIRAHLLIGILRCVLGRLLPWRAWKTSMKSWRLWKRWRRKRQMQLGSMPAGLQSAPCEHQVYLRCKFQRPASRVVHVEALLGSALQRDCSHYVWVHTRFIQLPPLFFLQNDTEDASVL